MAMPKMHDIYPIALSSLCICYMRILIKLSWHLVSTVRWVKYSQLFISRHGPSRLLAPSAKEDECGCVVGMVAWESLHLSALSTCNDEYTPKHIYLRILMATGGDGRGWRCASSALSAVKTLSDEITFHSYFRWFNCMMLMLWCVYVYVYVCACVECIYGIVNAVRVRHIVLKEFRISPIFLLTAPRERERERALNSISWKPNPNQPHPHYISTHFVRIIYKNLFCFVLSVKDLLTECETQSESHSEHFG